MVRCVDFFIFQFTCDIGEIQWFHGCLPRENAEKRLTNDGDYLVREHNQGKDVKYIVSVFWKGHRHFKYQKVNTCNIYMYLKLKCTLETVKISKIQFIY